MYKKISLFMAMLLIILSVSPIYAKTTDNQIVITLPENEKEINTRHIEGITVQSENKTDEEKMFSIVMALVDYKERVINYIISDEILDSNDMSKIKAYSKIMPNAYKIKVFAWDNLDDKNTISNIIDLSIANGYIEEEIVRIDELNETIPQWSEYNLPETISVHMNSGSTKVVPVKWNIDKVDTSKNGKVLIEGNVVGYKEEKVVLNLTISSVIKIVSINDIEITIEQNDNFKLSSTVLAGLSSGEQKRFAVKWDKNFVDTSIVGIQNFEGKVQGYDKSINLKLNVTAQNTSDKVQFNNTELEDILKEELGIESILKSDLLKITELNLQYSLIEDSNLEDLKYLKNLKKLDLSFNGHNFDLTPISNLTKLEKLNLFGNSINDISPLENLTTLKELNLVANKISNIDTLKNLVNLKTLKLNSNNIEDFTPTIKYYNNLTDKDFEVTFFTANNENLINHNLKIGQKIILPHAIKLSDGRSEFVNWERNEIKGLSDGVETIKGISDDGEKIYFECTIGDSEEDDRIVEFPDENLEKAIRIAIDKPKGEIYYSDVKNLKQLDAIARGIEDLTGLENLKELEKLGLWSNKIGNSQLVHLKGLTNLKFLDLAANKFTYIPANSFEGMSKLEELVLDENQITEIHKDAFNGLESLTSLLLEENRISNIDCVKKLNKLNTLFIRNNKYISDLTPLANLVNLKELWANDNNISNINALYNLTELEWIELENNKIKDISSLSNCTKITRLKIANNQIKNIDIVSKMTNLEWLEAKNNIISDVKGVAELVNLSILDLSYNKITNIEPLRKLTKLTQLYLKGNDIKDFNPVEDFYYNIKRTDFNL